MLTIRQSRLLIMGGCTMQRKHNDEYPEKRQQQFKPYRKDADYSYALGAFPTFELINSKPDIVQKVLVHTDFTDSEKLSLLCAQNHIPFEFNDKLISRISSKENCYVAGVFAKYQSELREDRPHLVLVNPGNMGNLGTIIRTAVGFGIYDAAIILPGADIFAPKTVRASMGALFKLSFQLYHSFEEYRQQFRRHEIFTFMTNGGKALSLKKIPQVKLYSLVFGNEASGLDNSYLKVGTSIYIPQTPEVDSLNLTIAVGIGIFAFKSVNPSQNM